MSQFECGEIQCVKSRESYKLKTVAHGGELGLKLRNLPLVQLGPSMKRRRAIVCQELSRVPGVNGHGELPGFVQVGFRRFAPQHIGIRCVCQAAGSGGIEPAPEPEEPFNGSLAIQESCVFWIAITGDELCGIGIGSGDQNGGDVEYVSS